MDQTSICNGCLASDTMISMEDFTETRVDEIKIGDNIIGDNAGKIMTVVNVLKNTTEKPCIRFEANLFNILVTENHPMVTDKGIKKAMDVDGKDKLLTELGYIAITSIEKEEYSGQVYNLELKENGKTEMSEKATMRANGYIVGDYIVQGKL
jgi:hypothetical protein